MAAIVLTIFVSNNRNCFATDASNTNIMDTESLPLGASASQPVDTKEGEEHYFVPVSKKYFVSLCWWFDATITSLFASMMLLYNGPG